MSAIDIDIDADAGLDHKDVNVAVADDDEVQRVSAARRGQPRAHDSPRRVEPRRGSEGGRAAVRDHGATERPHRHHRDWRLYTSPSPRDS